MSDRIEDGRDTRKIARLHRGRRDDAGEGLRLAEANALEVAEEERAIPSQRASQAGAELVLLERRSGTRRVEEILGVHGAVAQELE